MFYIKEVYQNLYEVSSANRLCYISMSGRQTICIQNFARLTESIDPTCLREAAALTVKRFPHWGMTLVLRKNKLYYTPAEGPLPVYPEGKTYALGTPDNGGYLFVISYATDTIHMRSHHGLADGRGTFAFEKTLLYHYLKLRGCDVDAEDKIVTLDTPVGDSEDTDAFDACKGQKVKPNGLYPAKTAFHPPERYDWTGEPVCRKFEFSFPIEPLLRAAKAYGSSPAPLLSVLIAKAFRNVYKTGRKSVTGNIPADLRPRLGIMNYQNCACLTMLPNDAHTSTRSVPEQARVQREMVMLQTSRENLIQKAKGFLVAGRVFDLIPLPFGAKQRLMMAPINLVNKSTISYTLTYGGKFDLPESMRRYVREIRMNSPGFDIPVTFAAVDYNGMMNVNLTQNFQSDALAKEFKKLLNELVGEVEYADCGTERYDTLITSDIPARRV